jgi:hypothetical protein
VSQKKTQKNLAPADIPTQVLLNTEVIAINQDITPQGFPTVPGDSSVWSRNLSDGSIAVALCVAICSPCWSVADGRHFSLERIASFHLNPTSNNCTSARVPLTLPFNALLLLRLICARFVPSFPRSLVPSFPRSLVPSFFPSAPFLFRVGEGVGGAHITLDYLYGAVDIRAKPDCCECGCAGAPPNITTATATNFNVIFKVQRGGRSKIYWNELRLPRVVRRRSAQVHLFLGLILACLRAPADEALTNR